VIHLCYLARSVSKRSEDTDSCFESRLPIAHNFRPDSCRFAVIFSLPGNIFMHQEFKMTCINMIPRHHGYAKSYYYEKKNYNKKIWCIILESIHVLPLCQIQQLKAYHKVIILESIPSTLLRQCLQQRSRKTTPLLGWIRKYHAWGFQTGDLLKVHNQIKVPPCCTRNLLS
jgi:hypothetical protein